MARKPLRLIRGGPSRDVLRAVAGLVAKLRREDFRAVGVVLVRGDGQVETMHVGAEDGHFFQLHSGAVMLSRRIEDETDG